MGETPPFKVQRWDQRKWKLKRVIREVDGKLEEGGPVETKGKPDVKIVWSKVLNPVEVIEDED